MIVLFPVARKRRPALNCPYVDAAVFVSYVHVLMATGHFPPRELPFFSLSSAVTSLFGIATLKPDGL